MARWSMESKMADVLAVPEAVVVLDEIIPGASKNPMMKMAKGFTFSKVAATPAAKLPEETMQKLVDALNAKVP